MVLEDRMQHADVGLVRTGRLRSAASRAGERRVWKSSTLGRRGPVPSAETPNY